MTERRNDIGVSVAKNHIFPSLFLLGKNRHTDTQQLPNHSNFLIHFSIHGLDWLETGGAAIFQRHRTQRASRPKDFRIQNEC